MDQVLVTGGTGVVGVAIVRQLAARGVQVRCLVREEGEASRLFSSDVDLTVGDITDTNAVSKAAAGCDTMFHAAGLPEQWSRHPGLFDRVNRGGTRNALEAARIQGVRLFIHVSTQDTFDLTRDPMDETMPSRDPHPSAYERSKIAAQHLVEAAGNSGAVSVRSLHPAAVYGPGAARPTGLTAQLLAMRDGRVPFLLSGGMPVVFNADVARAAIAAAERGSPGSKFILVEAYKTQIEMAQNVRAMYPEAPLPRIIPSLAARLVALGGEAAATLTGRRPPLTRADLNLLARKGRPTAAKACRELDWFPTPFIEGLRQTLCALPR